MTMTKQRSVLEVLFPPARAQILRFLFLPPRKERYVRELMGLSGLTLCAIQDELRKLSALQFVTSRSNQYHRFYRANHNHAIFRALVQIVENSEQTPHISHSALHRQTRGARRRKKLAHLSPDRPMRWNLFSKRPKT